MAIDGLVAIGAGLAIGLSALGAGIAESQIGAAGVGAIAENPKNLAKVLILLVIPETLILFGLVVSLKLMGVF
jgi:V/A-type H+-transporting ATPase subunit K